MHRHESGDTTAWLRTLDLFAYGDKARIVLAHGTVQDFGPAGDDEDEVGANNHLDLARLPHEQFDYIALGDWHGMKQISAKAWYSGTPEPDRFPRGVGNLPGHVLAVTLRRGEHPLVTPLATGRLRWHDLDHVMSDDGGLSRLYEILDQEMALGTGQDLLRLTLSGSLGMIGMTDLEACLETWRARLLRLRLHDRVAIAASDDEITALTQRADAPLIARVAAQLLAQSHSAGEQAEAAKNALRQLHAAALA